MYDSYKTYDNIFKKMKNACLIDKNMISPSYVMVYWKMSCFVDIFLQN